MKKYILTENELLVLLESDVECNALYNGGVDNWQWYGEAIIDYLDDEDEIADAAVKRLKDYKEVEVED